MAKSCALTIFSLFLCLFTIAALGLNVYHSFGHASYKNETTGDYVKETSSDTDTCPGAIKVKVEGYDTDSGDKVIYIIACPWRKFTKVIGILADIFCQIFLIFICFKAKGKLSNGVFGFVAFVVSILLIITAIMMVVDMIKGKKDFESSDTTSYQPLTYILNILFVVLGLVCGLICTCIGLQAKPANSATGNKRIPNLSQPTQAGNNSTFVAMNKTGYDDSRAYGNTQNENSFVNYGNNNGYLVNASAYNAQGNNNNLAYQTNYAQAQNVNVAQNNQNNRGYVGNRNAIENNMRGGQQQQQYQQQQQQYQQQDYAKNPSDTSNRSSVAHERRENRRVVRHNNPQNIMNNGYANNGSAGYANQNNNGQMPFAANYRG